MSKKAGGIKVNIERVKGLIADGATEIQAYRIERETNRIERATALGRKPIAMYHTGTLIPLGQIKPHVRPAKPKSLLLRMRSALGLALAARRAANKVATASRRINRA